MKNPLRSLLWWPGETLMPTLALAGGYPCCCLLPGSTSTSSVPPETSSRSPPLIQSSCNGCCQNAEVPMQWMVTISGLTDFGCGNCAALEQTYFLDYAPASGLPCRWEVRFPRTCTVDTLSLFITTSSGPAACRFQTQFTDSTGQNFLGIGPWQKFANVFTDCLDPNGQVLTDPGTDLPQCSPRNSIATAVPVL